MFLNTSDKFFKYFSPNTNERICIIVYGNIASGKSTFSKNLISILKDYTYVCLDRIRVDMKNTYTDMNPLIREIQCEQECIDMIFKNKLVLYETTAATTFFKNLILRIKSEFKTYFIFISCSIATCQKRYEIRKRIGHVQILPPYKKTLPINELLYRFEVKMYNVSKDLTLNSEALTPEQMIYSLINFFEK